MRGTWRRSVRRDREEECEEDREEECEEGQGGGV